MNYEHHEIAGIFPMLHAEELGKLTDDIRANGLIEPVVLYENKILDGRNRYAACKHADIDPEYVEYEGTDPVGYVVSLNLHRRHLSESQRAMVGAKIANLPHGGDRTEQTANLQDATRAQAADTLNVSERTVNTAKKVQREGSPELIEAVEQGKVSVSAAADVATLRKEEQADVVAKGEAEILAKAKEIRADKARIRKEANEELRKNTPPPVFTGKYDVLVIDPPWPIEKIERDERPNQVGLDYPTMDEGELANLDLPFNDNSHVFMWTTHKFLPMALRLFEAWGVKYVLTFVWHKPGGFQPFNLPQYNCEFALYGRVGSPSFVDTKAFNACFDAPRGAHSEKPEEFYDLLRRVTEGYRIDIFNRRQIEGFDTWGNES